jgi:hypothetical protein
LATAGSDFRPINDTFYPPAGATSFTVTLELMGDTAAECDEGLVLRFAGVYTGDETQKTARISIQNDDGPPALTGACPDPFTPDPTAPPPIDPPAAPAPTPAAGAETPGPAQHDPGRGCGFTHANTAAPLPLLLLALLAPLLGRTGRNRGAPTGRRAHEPLVGKRSRRSAMTSATIDPD